MIINAHWYFLGTHDEKEQKQAVPLRKRVATVLGVGEATVARVVSDWNKRNDSSFTPHKTARRPEIKSNSNPEVSEILRSIINMANLSGTILSTQILCQKLEENGYNISK